MNYAETRASQWKKMKKKNTQRLMPDDDTLNHICYRANYLAYCQKNFQLSRHPSPIGNGWGIIDGKCRPVRNVYPALPSDLPSQTELSDDENSDSDIDDCSLVEIITSRIVILLLYSSYSVIMFVVLRDI